MPFSFLAFLYSMKAKSPSGVRNSRSNFTCVPCKLHGTYWAHTPYQHAHEYVYMYAYACVYMDIYDDGVYDCDWNDLQVRPFETARRGLNSTISPCGMRRSPVLLVHPFGDRCAVKSVLPPYNVPQWNIESYQTLISRRGDQATSRVLLGGPCRHIYRSDFGSARLGVWSMRRARYLFSQSLHNKSFGWYRHTIQQARLDWARD